MADEVNVIAEGSYNDLGILINDPNGPSIVAAKPWPRSSTVPASPPVTIAGQSVDDLMDEDDRTVNRWEIEAREFDERMRRQRQEEADADERRQAATARAERRGEVAVKPNINPEPPPLALVKPSHLPDALFDAEMVADFSRWADEHGYNQREAQELLEFWAHKALPEGAEVFDTTKGWELLKAEWKGDFETKGEMARRCVRDLDRSLGGGLVEYLEASGAGNDPRVVMWFAKLAEALGEKRVVTGIAGPEDIQGQIDRINNDSRHPYWDANHRDHTKAVALME